MARVSMLWFAAASLALTGCAPRSAPYITVFESYFPSWILCAIIGVTGASMCRMLLTRLGLDEVLPCRPLVYLCLAVALMFLSSLLIFSR